MTPILILVHPGSLCGSADMNLGRYEARSVRDGIRSDLESWTGPIIVIDGSLSDELAQYHVLGGAIDTAVRRAQSAGLIGMRVMGDDDSDFDQVAAVRKLFADGVLNPAEHSPKVTGAWYHPEEDDVGCVNSVYETLLDLGFRPDVLDSAARLEDEYDDAEEDDAEPHVAP